MAQKAYDVAVIGAGPAGYVAAIRCAQLGLYTACIDSWSREDGQPTPGGTCLNVGCIPSKALLESTHHFSQIKHSAITHGIRVTGASMDISAMLQRKDKIVQTLTKGIFGLLKKNKVDFLHGCGRIKPQAGKDIHHVEINLNNGDKQVIETANIIIATGSKPSIIPSAKVDHQRVVDSTGALAFTEVPRKLGIIGAGVIGLELGSVWNRLGSEVTILEAMDSFLGAVDKQLADMAYKTFTKQGLDIKLGAKVTGSGTNKQSVIISYKDEKGKQQLEVDKLIIAVGRTPNTENIGAENCGLTIDNHGFIEINKQYQTALPNVYAIGDVVGGAMLAHKAAEEGVAVAEQIAGQNKHAHGINNETIPWVIYTWPEIAWVGMTQQELQENGIDYTVGTFPFLANGRAKAMGETDGMVKILADKHNDRILGIHILGANASELIAEAVLAMEFDASSEDLARTIHSHPSLSEALHEAALGNDNRTLHI